MRGRKPLPSWRRALDGNAGKRRLNVDEPKPELTDAAFLSPPAELAEAPLALAEWNRLAPLLHKARQVTDADRGALLAWCLEWARYLDATARVREAGLVVRTPNGYPIPNPFLSIASRALAGCTKLWPELGLTPSSRSRVGMVRAPDENDPFNEFDTPVPLGPRPVPVKPQ
jgi:P27 family predicted phage terminase small subunit